MLKLNKNSNDVYEYENTKYIEYHGDLVPASKLKVRDTSKVCLTKEVDKQNALPDIHVQQREQVCLTKKEDISAKYCPNVNHDECVEVKKKLHRIETLKAISSVILSFSLCVPAFLIFTYGNNDISNIDDFYDCLDLICNNKFFATAFTLCIATGIIRSVLNFVNKMIRDK